MNVKVRLVDINSQMVQAWHETFENHPEVEIVEGSMLDQDVDAWVSPTNSKGNMDGGLDGVIKNCLGAGIQNKVKQQIAQRYRNNLPVGSATCVATGQPKPRFLISTPTMRDSSQDISDTLNVALAASAALQAVHMQNAVEPDSIRSIALPGLGANTGRVPVEICADLMWTAYDLFCEQRFADFASLRIALEERLGDLGPSPSQPKLQTKPKTKPNSSSPTPQPQKQEDWDFDDFE